MKILTARQGKFLIGKTASRQIISKATRTLKVSFSFLAGCPRGPRIRMYMYIEACIFCIECIHYNQFYLMKGALEVGPYCPLPQVSSR